MGIDKKLQAWLNIEPSETEFVELANGARTIPIHIMYDFLDHITDQNWSAINFKCKYVILNEEPGVDASIELVLRVKQSNRTYMQRTLTGACTYTLKFIRELDKIMYGIETPSTNEHYAATAKSFCIVNAAIPIGARTGKNLNKTLTLHEPEDSTNDMQRQKEALKYTIDQCISKKQALKVIEPTNFSNDKDLTDYIDQKFPK